MKPVHFDKVALIQYRLEQAKSTLHDAQVLFEQGGTPVSVVNRAYYAIFYATMALIGTLKEKVDTSKHKGVIAAFNREFVKTGILPKEMSKILREAFEAWQEGDYRDLSTIIDHAKAGEILNSAVQFVNSIEAKLSK
jgi:uncharacterized protein (UPF0332 family)